MRSRLFMLASWTSAALCLATILLWARSYWVCDWAVLIHRHGPMQTSSVGAATWRGLLSADAYFFAPTDYGDPRDTILQYNRQAVGEIGVFPISHNAPRWLGFGGSVTGGRLMLTVPAWAVAISAGSVTWLTWRKARRLRRERELGLCPVCGYDLRATPDRCPECGTPAARKELGESRR